MNQVGSDVVSINHSEERKKTPSRPAGITKNVERPGMKQLLVRETQTDRVLNEMQKQTVAKEKLSVAPGKETKQSRMQKLIDLKRQNMPPDVRKKLPDVYATSNIFEKLNATIPVIAGEDDEITR